MALLTSAVVVEIQTRLAAIVAGQSTGIEDNTFYYTPATVLRGRRLLDENLTVFPAYSVIRGTHGEPDYDQSRRVFPSTLAVSVEGIVKIADRAKPDEDAEKAIADVVAAVLGAKDDKLGGLCLRCDWEGDEIEVSQTSSVAYFEVIFNVRLSRRRGGLGHKAP